MNVVDSAHATVHDYPGGSESLAPRLGMSPAVLNSKVNPNTCTHHLTLLEAHTIMRLTADHRMLHELAHDLGYVLTPASDAEAEVGLTGNELKALEKDCHGSVRATMTLLRKLRAVVGAKVAHHG